jgi:hypothetical protein
MCFTQHDLDYEQKAINRNKHLELFDNQVISNHIFPRPIDTTKERNIERIPAAFEMTWNNGGYHLIIPTQVIIGS